MGCASRVQLLGPIAACVVVAVVTAAAQTAKPATPGSKLKNPVAATPASIAAGQQLFQKFCRFCHGAKGDLEGSKPPKDMTPSSLADDVWDRGSTDGDIFVVIQEGAAPKFQMKGLKGKITDQDTWNLVNYVRTLSRPSKSD